MDHFLAIFLMNGDLSLKLSASLSNIYSNMPPDGGGMADMTDTPCEIGSLEHFPAQAIKEFAQKNLK